MSDNTTQRLPSLAHPLITNPFSSVVEEFLPHLRLPYPEIDPSWDGFELSLLRWVGYKLVYFIKSQNVTQNLVGWLTELAVKHEICHMHYSDTPFSLCQRYEQHVLNYRITETFEEGKEQIAVPLDPDGSRNALEKQWAEVVNYLRKSQLVQEVVAVRTSLLNTPGNGVVSHDFRKRLLAKYKEKYEEYIPKFTAAYKMFDSIAGKIGDAATAVMIENVFRTSYPTSAFAAILVHLWNQSGDCLRFLATLSEEEVDRYFTGVTNALDPDDLHYHRKFMMGSAPEFEQMLNTKSRMTQEGGFIGTLGSIHASLVSRRRDTWPYNNFNLIYHTEIHLRGDDFKHKVTYERIHGNYSLLLEAIRQQLTQGMGLVCPFSYFSRSCCGGRNRAFLEKVWARTSPASNCTFWNRLGCLEQ